MENSFRQSMRWVHTYSGLILGWLLFVIFVTGSASYYKDEITLWMQPELHKSVENKKSLDLAIDKAIENFRSSNSISVILPNSRSNTIKIKATTSNNTFKKRNRAKAKYYDATTAEELNPRITAGGNFLYRFHFELYKIPRNIARWIVGIAAMFMLTAIISGIIIHKRIFKDIFTFRPKNNPRGWMDAHILPSVATLPFLIMITYSGLLLFTNTMMPWAKKVYFDKSSKTVKKQTNKKTFVIENKDSQRIINSNRIKKIKQHKYNKNTHRLISSNANKQITIIKNKKDIYSITKSEVLLILAKANKLWPNNIGSFILKKDKKTNSVKIEVKPKKQSSIFSFKRNKESAVFDLNTEKMISHKIPSETLKSKISNTHRAIISLHMALFADSTLRFIFFVCGLSGIVLVGTGLILWTEKRKKKNKLKKSFGFFLVEKLNLGTIMGIFIAIAIYFIANRVIAYEEPLRKDFEIYAFFIAWILSYVYAFIRNTKKAWIEQSIFTSILFISLPILNALATFDKVSDFYTRDFILISFDIFFIFMASVFILITYILMKKSKKEK